MANKLKTLKDIESSYNDEVIEDSMRDNLREEARNWIDVINNKIKQLRDIESQQQSPLQKVATRGLDEVLEGQIRVLTDFLNLDDANVSGDEQ